MLDGSEGWMMTDDLDQKQDSQPPVKFRSWLVGYGGLGLAWAICFICQEIYNAFV